MKSVYLYLQKQMKVTFPKNIKKWMLSGMSISIWPLNITIVQLLLLALWTWLALAVFTSLKDRSGAAWALLFAIPIFVIFIVLAFFKVSEMGMLEYLAKIFRNKFFDVQKKYQINFEKNNETEIAIKEAEQNDTSTQVIEHKTENLDEWKKIVEDIEKSDLS